MAQIGRQVTICCEAGKGTWQSEGAQLSGADWRQVTVCCEAGKEKTHGRVSDPHWKTRHNYIAALHVMAMSTFRDTTETQTGRQNNSEQSQGRHEPLGFR